MSSDHKGIGKFIKSLESQVDQIRDQIIDICFHMQGGVTWEEGWSLSFSDREKIIKSVNKKLKQMSGNKREYM